MQIRANMFRQVLHTNLPLDDVKKTLPDERIDCVDQDEVCNLRVLSLLSALRGFHEQSQAQGDGLIPVCVATEAPLRLGNAARKDSGRHAARAEIVKCLLE